MDTPGKNFSNLSKFTTPELSAKREGAKPFNRNSQRRESFGLASPPFQDASQFNFDQAYQDPHNLTNQLPTKGPQMATSTRSTGTQNANSNGQPDKKVFRSEVHREPVRIPVKVLGADGKERMLPNNGPLDIEGMKKRMADQMASMGFGSGLGGFDNSFPSMDSIFNMGPAPMRKKSSGPEGKPATNVNVDVQKPGGNAANQDGAQRTPPKTFAKPAQPVHVSQNVKNINQASAKKPDDTASMETASEFDNGLGEQIKNSPPVARKNTPYHNQRRNSLKITPEVGEAALLAEISRAADEKNRRENNTINQEVEAKNASEESTPKSKEGEEAILSEKFSDLNQQILKISFDLCSYAVIHPDLYAMDEASLKKLLKQVLGNGEKLMRILFSLDAMATEDLSNQERISKKVLSNVGYFWQEKADYFKEEIKTAMKEADQSHIDC